MRRSDADSLVLQLLGNELTDVNVYKHRVELSNSSIFPLYRDLDSLLVPFNNCYMYFVDNIPNNFWSNSGRYIFVDKATSTIIIREKTRFPKNFSLLAYEAEYELLSYAYEPQNYRNPPQVDVINLNSSTPRNETHDNLYAVIIAPRFHDENPYNTVYIL